MRYILKYKVLKLKWRPGSTWLISIDFALNAYICVKANLYIWQRNLHWFLQARTRDLSQGGGRLNTKNKNNFQEEPAPPPPGVFFIPSKLLLLYLRSQCPIYNDTLAWNLNLITDVEDVPSIFLLGKCVFLIISLFPLFGNAHVTLAEKLNSYKETKAWISKSNSKQNLS